MRVSLFEPHEASSSRTPVKLLLLEFRAFWGKLGGGGGDQLVLLSQFRQGGNQKGVFVLCFVEDSLPLEVLVLGREIEGLIFERF